ncbi:MAG: hypothetical protein RIQ33_483 [Bacteroidota bacterium]|jgi:hypothetical protein
MKKIILFIVLAACSMITNAQGFEAKKATEKKVIQSSYSPFYIGTSMGINNPYGFLALNFEVPIKNQFTIAHGFGISTWNTKFGLVAKYYTKPHCLGWAYGMGLTYSRGSAKFNAPNIPTTVGNQVVNKTVPLELIPQLNLCANAYKYWRISTNSRFYLHFGVSIAMSGTNKFNVLSTDKITDDAKNSINAISPGGLSLGLGFQFGSNP